LEQHTGWAEQNINSDDDATRLAAAKDFYSFQHNQYGDILYAAVKAEEDALIAYDEAKAKAQLKYFVELKTPRDGAKGMSDTAAEPLSKLKANSDPVVLESGRTWSNAKAWRRKVEHNIKSLELLANNAKFSARAAAGEWRDLGKN
jgi:hypothetical protein